MDQPRKHPQKALTQVRINSLPKAGRYGDGNGLYLVVDPSGAKRWVLRTVIHGKRRDVGLGGLRLVSLAEARAKALEYRKMARDGQDPLEARRKARTTVPTFAEAAQTTMQQHRTGWKDEKHPSQWMTDQDSGGDARYAVPVHVEEGSDLVLAMPHRSDLRKLREGYVDPPRCLQVGETIADHAVMIVVAALSDLPVIENYFLPYFGFEGIAPRLFLSRLPAGPEVTEAQVIIVADRGSGNRARLSEIVWPAEGETIDPLTLAAQLVPDARKKLALFASEDTDGWQSIVGDANWGQVDG
jgi:Arm DNA-binding domain